MYAQTEKLGDLTMQCLNEAHEKFGRYILPWYRGEDLPDTEPVGLYNLASRLVADQLEAKDMECSFVYACRDDAWIDRHLDDFPDIDPKAVFAAKTDALGVTTSDIARALNVTARSVKDWKNPKNETMLPVDDAWEFLDEYAAALVGRTAQLLKQAPSPLPYHPTSRQGTLTQQERIENRAALAVAKRLMSSSGTVVGFMFVL